MTSALRRITGRIAAAGPPPVFAAVGEGARDRVEHLSLRRDVRLVPSPRHATILLVAGRIPPACEEALERVHDQLPHPRATLSWGPGAAADSVVLSGGAGRGTLPSDADPVPELVALHRALLLGMRGSEVHLLPDEPASPWRGLGVHGQGGEGMMGGTPYGRPMATTREDVRDGLALDRLELTVGPFLPAFPPGLVLEIALQGDVLQEVGVVRPPFPQLPPDIFERVLSEDVPAADVEVVRARILLRRIARVLRVAGAPELARRTLFISVSRDPDVRDVRRLSRLLHGGGTLAALPRRGGRPSRGDEVRGRVTTWLAEADRILTSVGAGEAGGRKGPVEVLEELGSPFADAPDPRAAIEWLPAALPGMEWGEAAVTIAALDPVPVTKRGGHR